MACAVIQHTITLRLEKLGIASYEKREKEKLHDSFCLQAMLTTISRTYGGTL